MKNEGFSGMWRGLLPTLAMTMPFTAIQFRVYGLVLQLLTDVFPKSEYIFIIYKNNFCNSKLIFYIRLIDRTFIVS